MTARLLRPGCGRGRTSALGFPLGANVFYRDNTASARAANQTLAKKIANQFNYGNTGYTFSGYAGTGYATETGTTYTAFNFFNFSPSLFIVPANQPTARVAFLKHEGEEEEPPGAAGNLQSYLEAVPVPVLSSTPSGHLTDAEGTDHHVTIIQEGTRKMWTFWKFERGEAPFMCRAGGYVPDIARFDGIFPAPPGWGGRASGLMLPGGVLTMADLVNVLRGGRIEHALCVTLPQTGPGFVGPATKSDVPGGYQLHVPEKHEGLANPAFGTVDAVPEGSWFTYPSASNPEEHGISSSAEPIAWAIYEAIREYGVVVVDGGGGSAKFVMEAPVVAGSPYGACPIDPRAGAPTTWNTGAITWIPAGMGDAALPKITERISGEESCLTKQPWSILERLEPFTS